jgi:DNA-binding CsgD family transcriptional regulator
MQALKTTELPTARQLPEILRLWDHLSDTHASELDSGSLHLMRTISEWIGADKAFWNGILRIARGASARRDPQHGWRTKSIQTLQRSALIDRASAHVLREQRTGAAPMTICALMAQAGRFRSCRLHELVDLSVFRETDHYKHVFEPFGIVDRIYIAFPVNDEVESLYCFDRFHPQRPFTERERNLAAFALRAIKYFHRELLLSHGLQVAREPLMPSERRILAALLTGKSEKEIAAGLNVSYATVHSAITAILRKFGVNSRAALMTLWLQ